MSATQPLIPAYSETQTSYNFGPRKSTDRGCGFAFVGIVAITCIWILTSVGYGDYRSDGSHTLPWVDFDPVDGACAYSGSSSDLTDGNNVTAAQTLQFVELIALPTILSVLAAFFFGFMLVVGFRKSPAFMVYSMCVIKVLTPACAGIALLASASTLDSCTNGTSNGAGGTTTTPAPDDNTGAAECNAVFVGAAMVLLGSSALIALLLWCWRGHLRLLVKLFKESAIGVQENWSIIPVNAALVLVASLAWMMMASGSVWKLLHGQVTLEEVVDPTTGASSPECVWQPSSDASAFFAFSGLAMGWLVCWSLETRTYIVGDSIGSWYWHGKENSGNNVYRAAKQGLTTHFGSMAFAGLVLWFVEALKKAARSKSDNVIMCLLKWVALCILSYIEFLCKMSVIVVGITGQPFITSGKQVISLFTASFGDLSLSTGVWALPGWILGGFVFIMSLAWGLCTGFAAKAVVQADNCRNFNWLAEEWDAANGAGVDIDCNDLGRYAGLMIGLFTFLVVAFILGFFTSILLAVVDTVFMCFMIDKSKGIVTKPEIHEVIGTVLHKRGKAFVGGPAVQATPAPQHQNQQPPPMY